MRRNQEIHRQARHWNDGVRTIDLKDDLEVLVANRDQLWREAHHYYHELQLANQEIVKANSHITQLSRDIENQDSTNTRPQRKCRERKHSASCKPISYYGGVGRLLKSLAESRRRRERHIILNIRS